MAPTSVPNTINRQHVGQALRHYRRMFADNNRELTAINKAALNLEACLWTWTGNALVIESATQTGLVRYHVQYDVCDCHAAACGKACWHRAAYRLLKKASDISVPQNFAEPIRPRRSAEDRKRILREAAELC
jgi:hypothetical protein